MMMQVHSERFDLKFLFHFLVDVFEVHPSNCGWRNTVEKGGTQAMERSRNRFGQELHVARRMSSVMFFSLEPQKRCL